MHGIVNLAYILIRHSIWPTRACRNTPAWIRFCWNIWFSDGSVPENAETNYWTLQR
jgi:hypothetical protein